MKYINFKHTLIIFGTMFFALIAALWSWNTVSELFGGPHAQFKHIIAVTCLLLITKYFVTSKWNHKYCTNDTTQKIA